MEKDFIKLVVIILKFQIVENNQFLCKGWLFMKIQKLPISKIKPYRYNAKKHPQSQIEHIKASIKKFGFNDPIGIWGKKNEVVEGHGRLEALKQLGYEEVGCVRLDHLSEEERRAYMLVHNQVNLETGFEISDLSKELDEIFDIDMTSFGFEELDEKAEIEKVELKPYNKIHYLISFDLNLHDEVLNCIKEIENISGVEVISTLN